MLIRIIPLSLVLPLCLLVLLLFSSPIHSSAFLPGQNEVTAAQFAAALEAHKQASARLTRSQSAEQKFQELSAKLQKRGTVRILLQLRVEFRPEGEIQQIAGQRAQGIVIKQVQD